jgi:hypothetical protein
MAFEQFYYIGASLQIQATTSHALDSEKDGSCVMTTRLGYFITGVIVRNKYPHVVRGSAHICCCPNADCGYITLCTALMTALTIIVSEVVLSVHIQAARI